MVVVTDQKLLKAQQKANGIRQEDIQIQWDLEWGVVWMQRRQWHPTPRLLPGGSYEQRSLVGCSPWGHWELDMTERFPFRFSLSCIGEGKSNPLQCSCLENPRDRGAWWAAIYGVAQSQTWLQRLSSSSSSSSVDDLEVLWIFRVT